MESAIVRLYSSHGQIVGTGCLVGERQVLTCAHVVARALDLPSEEVHSPAPPVSLDFPLVAPAQTITGRISLWQHETDIAVLNLEQPPPPASRPLSLLEATELWDHPFRAFGFPSGYQAGVWAAGRLRSRQAEGWLQIEDEKQTGYFVAPGFSGVPVWGDTLQGVIGLVVAADITPGVRAAFVIPTPRLRQAWPELPVAPAAASSSISTPSGFTSIGGVHLSGGDSTQVRAGDLTTNVTAQRDIIGGDQINYNYYGASPPSTSITRAGRLEFYDRDYLHLPAGYLERTELLAELKPALLAAPGQLALTSALKINALHGMGGIGKSVMARALCADPEIQAAFPDGTLWTTLGQEPDEPELKAKLRDWIRALGGIISETNPSLDRLKNLLAEQLKGGSWLLVIDDVWRANDASLFNVGGLGCCLLLTTRDREVVHKLGAKVQDVPLMTLTESRELLNRWAGGRLTGVEIDLKDNIAKRLGRLPLALKLAGAQLRDEDPNEWLEEFEALSLKANREENHHDNLKTTFELSLSRLELETRYLYTTLAIFKEDEAIPIQAIQTLWAELRQVRKRGVKRLLQDLDAQELLQFDPTNSTVTLHDLLRELSASELGVADRLAVHQALLRSYRRTQTGEGWPTAPDDGYLYDHLAYHLAQVADHDPVAAAELQALFANDHWLHARVPQSGYLYDGYLADLTVVVQRSTNLANQQIKTSQPAVALVDLVHYALIRSSINALAANYVPALVARAVETGLGGWTASRALSLAAKILDPRPRAEIVVALLKLETSSSEQRARAQQIGLQAALALWREDERANTLAVLAPQLTGPPLQEALKAALAFNSERNRANALVALAPQLEPEARTTTLQEALKAVLAIHYGGDRARTLAALAPQLTGPSLQEALKAALTNPGDEELTALAPQLEPEARTTTLQEALKAALAIHYEEGRARALAALAPQLEGHSREEALQVARQAIVDYLRKFEGDRRDLLFWFLSDETLINPAILGVPSESLAEIARHIIEVGNEWRWL